MAGTPAVVVNLSAYANEDTLVQDTIYQSDGITPQNITNWSISFVLHVVGDSTASYFTKTVGSGITITNPTQGILQVQINSTDLPPSGEYEYYIARTDSGNYRVLTRGMFTILRK